MQPGLRATILEANTICREKTTARQKQTNNVPTTPK